VDAWIDSSEARKLEANQAHEERAAEESLKYFEQRSDESAWRSPRSRAAADQCKRPPL